MTKPPFDALSSTQRSPWFLPDGQHFIYHVADGTVWAGSLDGTTNKQLLTCDSHAVYAQPGYLFCLRDNTLVAHQFDASKLEVRGAPFVVSEKKVIQRVLGARGHFSLSDRGVLLYRALTSSLVLADYNGSIVPAR